MSIRIALFGQPRVVSADGSREYQLPRKTLNVLGYLILNRARPVTRDSIAFALFPDEDEEKARTSLRRNLSYLLSSLPDGKRLVSVDSERLSWNTGTAHVDVIAFEDALRAGSDEDALAEYAGQLLPTIYDEWTTADRERLRDTFHEALVRTIARERSQRRFDAATARAHRLLEEDPWREDVVRQLIAIRYEAADRAGALAAFERFATRLRDEMQAEPMPETIALRDAVLRGARLASSDPRPSTAAAGARVDVALPFVGRDADMQRARECWHSAADGRSGLLLVAGEAGAGKSRFVTELARLVEREGGSVLRGYTPGGGEHRPYEAFVEALQAAPDLLDDQMSATLTDDRAARLRLFDSVRSRLSESSRRRVLALVLEDLHWAGAATIDLLEFVVRRLERDPVLIVATFRDDELPRAHPLRALVRQLQGRGSVTELVLERLSAPDAATAMRAALPEASVDETAIARAVAWADGVPLLLDEAMRDLAAGRTSDAADITTLVGERFERLSPKAETALVFGAVLGERFELDTLAAVTGWRDSEVIEAIGEGIDNGLLRASSRSPGLAFSFRHDLIRVAATQRIAQQELVRAHGLIARALSAQAGEDGSRAGEIAHHFADAGEPLRAAEYYRRAGRYALDVFANEDAIQVATLGLELCGEADPAQRRMRYDLIAVREHGLARIGELERCRADARALVSLADGADALTTALERLFDAHREDAGIRAEALATLATLAPASPRASRTLLYLCARDANARGDYSAARDAAIQAYEAFDGAGEERAAMMARFTLLGSLKLLGDTHEGVRVIDELRPRMEASDDLAMRAEFHRVASAILIEALPLDPALDDARRSLAFALRIGDRFAEARARQNVAVIAARGGAYEEALEQQERALAAYLDLGHAEGAADSIINFAAWCLFCGDFAECERFLGEFGPLERHNPLTQMKFVQLRALLQIRCGESDGENSLLEARRRAELLKASFFVARMNRELAHNAAAHGRLDEAVSYLDAALEDIGRSTNRAHQAETYAISARIRAAIGDERLAREHASLAMRMTQGGERIQALSEIAWNSSAAHALLGDTETAMKLAETSAAAAVQEAMDMPARLAETFLALPWHRQAVDYLWGRDVPLRWR